MKAKAPPHHTPECRDCKGTGLLEADDEYICTRCDGLGESELADEEKAADKKKHDANLKKLNRVFSDMLNGVRS